MKSIQPTIPWQGQQWTLGNKKEYNYKKPYLFNFLIRGLPFMLLFASDGQSIQYHFLSRKSRFQKENCSALLNIDFLPLPPNPFLQKKSSSSRVFTFLS